MTLIGLVTDGLLYGRHLDGAVVGLGETESKNYVALIKLQHFLHPTCSLARRQELTSTTLQIKLFLQYPSRTNSATRCKRSDGYSDVCSARRAHRLITATVTSEKAPLDRSWTSPYTTEHNFSHGRGPVMYRQEEECSLDRVQCRSRMFSNELDRNLAYNSQSTHQRWAIWSSQLYKDLPQRCSTSRLLTTPQTRLSHNYLLRVLPRKLVRISSQEHWYMLE